MITELVADRLLILAREIKHRRGKIDTDDLPLRADKLSDDIAGFATAGAEIQNRFACADIARWIAAAIVFVDDFLRNDFKQTLVVTHGQAKTLLDVLSGVAVTLQHRCF